MEEHDPLKQLQSFIDDRGQTLEQISSIQSALQAISSTELACGETEAATTPSSPRPGARERSYDLLLLTLGEMRTQIEERVRPLVEETLRAEEARLREQYSREKKGLEECAARIDQCILNCHERVDEYEKRRAELARLNQRLAALGADCMPLPEPLEAETIAAIVSQRLDKLRVQGKL